MLGPDPSAVLRTLSGETTGSHGQRSESPPFPVPDHRLIRRIGQGAYGEVWLARNALGTWRAIKFVRRSAFDDDRPFEREFAGIRQFEPISRSHESQLNILHVGRAQDGFYYVMELADDMGHGQEINDATYTPRNLRSELHLHGRLSTRECLRIGLALTTALEHLHKHGLVHRDIKPSNIVFVNGIPKLADIGLVARAEATASFVGTEGFLPPEGPGTRQADIYSLGKVLYEISTGHDRNQFPELPTNIAKLPDRAGLSELNEVLLKACHRDPHQRYQTAAEMHAELALLESGRSVVRLRGLERRLRLAQRVALAVLLLAGLVAGGWSWQARQTRFMRQLAEEKMMLAEDNRQRIVRLDVANGVRLLDEGDPAGALLWFADALPLLASNAAEASIHRIRIQQTVDEIPRLLRVFAHESSVHSAAFAPSGDLVATGTRDGNVRLWNAFNGSLVWGPKKLGGATVFLRFSHDGKRLFASSTAEQGAFHGGVPSRNFYAALHTQSGLQILPASEPASDSSEGLICSHFSQDDRWLAVARRPNRIQLFDLENARLVTELRGHADEVRFLSFNADSSLLASASLDHTVRLWRLPSGEPLGPPLEHRFPVVRVLFAGDGRHLLTASFASPGLIGNVTSEAGEGEIQAWETTGRRIGEPLRGRDWLLMYLNPAQPERYFVGNQAYTFAAPGRPLFKLEAGNVQSWDFTQDNRWLALGGARSTARLFEATNGEARFGPFPHIGEVRAIHFSSDGKRLLTGGDDGDARIWDLSSVTGKSLFRRLPVPLLQNDPVAFGALVGRLPGMTPVELETGIQLFNDQLQEILQFPMSTPDWGLVGLKPAWRANLWLSQQHDPDKTAVILCRPHGSDPRPVSLQHPDEVVTAAFSPDDHFVISSCRDAIIRYWNTSSGTLAKSVPVRDAAPGLVPEINPDGHSALWIPTNLTEHPIFRFVDLATGKFLSDAVPLPQLGSFHVRFSANGKLMALWHFEGRVVVYACPSGEVISSSIQHSGNLNWVEWAPDSHRLLTAGFNEDLLIWDARRGAQLLGPLQLPGTDNRIAHWSLDGRFIVARNNSRKVRVWDAATGEAITPVLNHSGDVAFALLTGNNRLISASYPDQLRAWDLRESALAPDILLDYAKLLSGRSLSSSGALLTLKPEEQAKLNNSLRIRAPQLFE